ncbi:MAG: endonuclease domain-containing protein [bacterium]
MTQSQIIPYNPKLKELARKLRSQSTLSEVILWNYLKNKKMRGYKFLRQKPLFEYIVDFFCPELMLAIEIDGMAHNERAKEDKQRQQFLEKTGIRFLRFYDHDVKKNIEGVLKSIEKWIAEYENKRDLGIKK